MAITRLKRKHRKNIARANNKQRVIKQLLATPVIKNVDVEELKAQFGKKSEGGVVNRVEEAVTATTQQVAAKVEDVVATVTDKVEDSTSAVAETSQTVVEKVEDVVDTVKDKVSSIFEAVKDKVGDVVESVKENVDNVLNTDTAEKKAE
jgi:phage-related protein